MITFSAFLPITETMIFEGLFEDELRLSPEDKLPIIANGIAAYLLLDSFPAGEIYGITPRAMSIVAGEEIEDCDPDDDERIYCYSTAILPAFQHRGFGKLLKAHWLGRVAERGFSHVIGHSTAPEMESINRLFGATERKRHARWYGTNRTASFYEIPLGGGSAVQRFSWDCGIVAVEYVVRSRGRMPISRDAMVRLGGTSVMAGTSHEGIREIASANGLLTTDVIGPAQNAPPLTILNYQWEGDGHYGVLIKAADDRLWLYNPATGRIDEHTYDEFSKIFYSDRYDPPMWGMSCAFP